MIIGASPNPTRYAFKAANMLLDFDHSVVLYGIKKGEIRGITIQNEWPSNESIDTITLYINPKLQVPLYENILRLAPKRVIFNPGTENDELVKLANENGIEALYACTLVLLQTNQY
ncbi:MAG: CoA-binding protein [Bacteroidia bacterium]